MAERLKIRRTPLFIHSAHVTATTSLLVRDGTRFALSRQGCGVLCNNRSRAVRRPAWCSDPPRCASDDLHAVAEYVRLPRFHLVSVAAGASVALDYAISHPRQLRSLVIADAHGGIRDPDYLELLERIRPPEFQALPRLLRELSAGYRALHPEGSLRWQTIESSARHEHISAQRERNQLSLAALDGVTTPTLAVAGDADFTTPPAIMRVFTSQIAGCEWVTIPEAGHCAFWEQPEVWNAHVIEFLSRH